MSTEAPATTPLYVYGVIAPDAAAPAAPGIAGETIRTIVGDGVAVLISDLPDAEHLTLGREEITTHAEVLERALHGGTVLPMRFGVVMADEEALRSQLLDAHHDELREQLEELAGKVELRLRAVYEEATLMREVVAENVQIAKLRQAIQGQSQDASYYARIQLGELVVDAVQQKREDDTGALLDELAPLTLDMRVGEPGNERVALSASFLVEEKRIEEFDAAVEEIGRQQDTRMRLKYTGPLPPYSFVELSTEA